MPQSQSVLKQKAREFPCLFVALIETYNKVGLKSCETKESQVWRYASGGQAAKRLPRYHEFIPELIDLQPFLNSYSICEKHYNQIISTNYFYQQLLDDSLIDCNKRCQIDTNPDDTNSSKSINFNNNETTLLNDRSYLPGTFKNTEGGSLITNQKTQSVSDLTNIISQLKQVIEDQSRKISELKKVLMNIVKS